MSSSNVNNWDRMRTLAAVVSSLCLILMAFESVRQTDIARKDSRAMGQVVQWIEEHIAGHQNYKSDAELFYRQLQILRDEKRD